MWLRGRNRAKTEQAVNTQGWINLLLKTSRIEMPEGLMRGKELSGRGRMLRAKVGIQG